jgi:hypothetical protein
MSPFGMLRFASASYYFANLHTSLNQGARVFAHLFGLLGCFILTIFTTPACMAYSSINSSTYLARASLFNMLLDSIFCSPCINSG